MMKKLVRGPSSLHGEVIPPGDKSISHRAVILNSIATGKATITNLSPGADCRSTISCLKALGVEIEERKDGFTISGVGGYGLREAENVLDAGNSATTIRLLAGLLAAQPFLSIITGDHSLRSRPMGRIIRPLRLMGASIWGRGDDSFAPLAIRGGKLRGIDYSLPIPSAQLKSALIIAALFAEGTTTIEETIKSRDHTERMLKSMGANLEIEGNRVTITPGHTHLAAMDILVPGDISAAAFWLVAAAIHPNARIRILNCGINPTRSGIIDALTMMGARLRIENQRMESGEPVADLCIESSSLQGIEIQGELIPRLIDEIPVVAVAASVAKGTTVIRGASELRVKESDRIRTTASELSKMGALVEELPDGMVIRGGRRLAGAECHSHGDHRLAMTLGVAAVVAEGETVIDQAEAVDISYPGFWRDLERLSER